MAVSRTPGLDRVQAASGEVLVQMGRERVSIRVVRELGSRAWVLGREMGKGRGFQKATQKVWFGPRAQSRLTPFLLMGWSLGLRALQPSSCKFLLMTEGYRA